MIVYIVELLVDSHDHYVKAAFSTEELAAEFLEKEGYLLDTDGWVKDPMNSFSDRAAISPFILDERLKDTR